jgi:hypothetical protein
MNDEQLKVLRELSDLGYAIVIITPEELDDASPSKVEDRLIELSWDIINDLKD